MSNLDSDLYRKNEEPKSKLFELLKEDVRPVLLVGAGSSSIVGYPTWLDLIKKLRSKFAEDLPVPTDNTDLTLCADEIKKRASHEGKLVDYHNFLYEEFAPRSGRPNYVDLHLDLVRLPFCGIVTPNYDEVMENAVVTVASDIEPETCGLFGKPLDLCCGSKLEVFTYLRELSTIKHTPRYKHVLHLHGHYRSSDSLILTQGDYIKRYGEGPSSSGLDEAGMALDTFHRKVIWSLLVSKPIVFVGFSMRDPFMDLMLNIVTRDFELGSKQAHYLILGYAKSENPIDRTYLIRRGIVPVYYNVPPSLEGELANHDGLSTLIAEFRERLGIRGTDTASISKQMREL